MLLLKTGSGVCGVVPGCTRSSECIPACCCLFVLLWAETVESVLETVSGLLVGVMKKQSF